MAYCTLADIKKLIPEHNLIQATDDENAGIVNQARIDEAIAQGDSEIDAYLGGTYAVPMSPVPDIVKKISVDFAIYNLYSRNMESIPETRKDRYQNGQKLLEKINKGEISIGEATEPTASAIADPGPQVSTDRHHRVFTRRKLRGF